MDLKAVLLLNYSAIILVLLVNQMMKRNRPRSSRIFIWISWVAFFACIIEALSCMHMPLWFPMWLYRLLMVADFTIGDALIIGFLMYSYNYISERTKIDKRFFSIPIVMLCVGIATTAVDACMGGVFEIVDRTCIRTTGKPVATAMEMIIIPYLPLLPIYKHKELGIFAVVNLGLFGIIPLAAILHTFIYGGEDYSFLATAFALLIMYIFLESSLSEENERMMRKKAEEANRAKSRFLLNMSHDIRTPMNAIVGYTELISHNLDDKGKAKDYLEKITTSSHFLLGLINNVLEMARIESGKTVIEEKPCEIELFCREIRNICSDAMVRKHINYTYEHDFQAKAVYGDPIKVKEIFVNILSNAIKYTPEGGSISVKVKQLPTRRNGYVTICVSVLDTGIGMSQEYLPKVFEEFEREKTSTGNKIEGTGLGLPIVKKLVESMGGTISVESEQGKGSTFVITLEQREVEESEMATVHHPETQMEGKHITDKCILLAEDNDLNAEITTELLAARGIKVERVVDGSKCVERMAIVKPEHYGMILMDIQMPVMNGYEATRSIRSMNDPIKASMPIYAMTANAFEEDKRKAFEAGMNGHLSKPIDITELMNVVKKVMD